jgi:hypothetical protein
MHHLIKLGVSPHAESNWTVIAYGLAIMQATPQHRESRRGNPLGSLCFMGKQYRDITRKVIF